MDANEQRARELLADQYEAARLYETADGLRAGLEIDEHGKLALRAIRQALAQQVPADGEWVLVPRWRLEQVYGMAREGCESPTAGYRWCERIDSIMHGAEPREEYAEYARPLPDAMLAATPQAPQPVVDGTEMIESAWLNRLTRFIGPGAMAYLSRLHLNAAALAAHGKGG